MVHALDPVTTSQLLDLNFHAPGREPCTVNVTVDICKDPKKYGNHLLFPETPIHKFFGFPVTNAKVHSPKSLGYGAYYGWIQVTRDIAEIGKVSSAPWEMDPVPVHKDCNTPFVFFGPEPQLFDMPSRTADPVEDIDWEARSYLCYVDDALLTKNVRPVLAFQWGFWIVDGKAKVKKVREVDVKDAWEECRGFFGEEFPGWSFLDKIS